MSKIVNDKIRWHDRKRICGIPCTFTKYTMDDDRLYIQTGFFKTEINEILLYRILDVKSVQTLGQKIFGVGTIMLYSADQSNRTLELKNIKNPVKTHHFISEVVEKERIDRKIAGRELAGSASFAMDSVGNDNDNDDDIDDGDSLNIGALD